MKTLKELEIKNQQLREQVSLKNDSYYKEQEIYLKERMNEAMKKISNLCDKCGSRNTYFTKADKFCRSCGNQSKKIKTHTFQHGK
jgi:ribosomal protein L37E